MVQSYWAHKETDDDVADKDVACWGLWLVRLFPSSSMMACNPEEVWKCDGLFWSVSVNLWETLAYTKVACEKVWESALTSS